MSCPRHPAGDGPSWCQDCHGVHPIGFDPDRGDRAKEEAIERVDVHADELVKSELKRLAREVARRRELFTTDAVRYLYELEGNPPIREPRVLGPIMRGLEGAGVVEATEEFRLSVWEKNHRRPVRVWRSLIWSGQS